jgi:dihydropteroate synthase
VTSDANIETPPPRWHLRTRSVSLTRPLIVGIVNVTPDSFSDGGRFAGVEAAIAHARLLVENGAHVVDVGGESTRPGAEPVSESEELARVLPVVEMLASEGVIVSVDTAKPEVARAAVDAGAEIVNDITAASEAAMARVMASTGAGVVLMHMRGTPRTMQEDPRYDDVVGEVRDYLLARAAALQAEGLGRDHIMIDPGIGFGKTFDHNLRLLAHLGDLVVTGYPVMVGASRKSFLGRLTGQAEPSGRDPATAAVTALVVASGAAAVRVHDVESSRQAAAVAAAIANASI